jgi:aspartate carbamoyltransferase catalytic subunit
MPARENPFFQRDVISLKDFSREELELLFRTSDAIERKTFHDRIKYGEGRILGSMFFEPSTRTRLSFDSAICFIGGSYIGFSEAKTTSLEKGESFADTIRVMEGYSDVLLIRHPMEGSSRFAAEVASRPVINGGSGTEEHPTQAMLDLYTIEKEVGRIDGATITILGDLKYGRTVYSLLYGLSNFDVKVNLVSPSSLKLRKESLDLSNHISIEELESVEEVIPTTDVLYVTRIQKERFPDLQEYEKVAGSYSVNLQTLSKARKDLVILHPLPRTKEIHTDVDKTAHAKYFDEVRYGRSLRAALLALILNQNV